MPFSPTLTVDLSAICANYCLLSSKLGGGECAAVVKADAYGLGVEKISQSLWQEGCRRFFVATLEEGIELRGILPEAEYIYVFHGMAQGEENDFTHHRLMPVLNTPAHLENWKLYSEKAVGAALHIDTGITRLGFSESECTSLSQDELSKHKINLIMSHLACAHNSKNPKNEEQRLRFEEAKKGFSGIKTSFANSGGVFLPSDYHYDLARPGCALYGIRPSNEASGLQHVATLSAPILQIRKLEKDETVGYGASYMAKKDARIALVQLGYADGYMRSQGNKGSAIIEGIKVPIAGRVSMDMIALDISDIAESSINVNSRAEFINGSLSVNHIAKECETIGYEIFTRIGKRVKRVYI